MWPSPSFLLQRSVLIADGRVRRLRKAAPDAGLERFLALPTSCCLTVLLILPSRATLGLGLSEGRYVAYIGQNKAISHGNAPTIPRRFFLDTPTNGAIMLPNNGDHRPQDHPRPPLLLPGPDRLGERRSEEHTSELQSRR